MAHEDTKNLVYAHLGNRVTRRRERKFNRAPVVQKSDQIYPVRSRARANFLKAPQPIVALV